MAHIKFTVYSQFSPSPSTTCTALNTSRAQLKVLVAKSNERNTYRALWTACKTSKVTLKIPVSPLANQTKTTQCNAQCRSSPIWAHAEWNIIRTTTVYVRNMIAIEDCDHECISESNWCLCLFRGGFTVFGLCLVFSHASKPITIIVFFTEFAIRMGDNFEQCRHFIFLNYHKPLIERRRMMCNLHVRVSIIHINIVSGRRYNGIQSEYPS